MTISEKNSYQLLRATQEDIGFFVELRNNELKELIKSDFEETRQSDLDQMTLSFTNYISDGLTNGTMVLVKATFDKEIVATGAASIIDFPATPKNFIGKAAYIHTMYTIPNHRRKGLAKRILDELIAWCKEKRLKLIILAASDEGMKLYGSKGFKVWNTWMYLEQ